MHLSATHIETSSHRVSKAELLVRAMTPVSAFRVGKLGLGVILKLGFRLHTCFRSLGKVR